MDHFYQIRGLFGQAYSDPMLDVLSGGRAYLGLGAAWYEDEAKGFGIPYPSTAERFELLEDNLKKAHCAAMGRDYATVEKTTLGTVNLSGNDTAESVLRRCRSLAQMGFTHAIFNMPDAHNLASLETFGKVIIPAAAEL
jgi:hypothetical protein